MTAVLILFLILPAAVAVAAIATSTWLIIRTRHAISQILLGAPVIFTSALSLWILKNRYAGAYPTYVPHLAIVSVCLVVAIQLVVARHRR